MNSEPYIQFARYNQWMNARIYGMCAGLDDADRRRDLGAFFGSIHLTLTHLLITDRAWLARLAGDATQFRFPDRAGTDIPVTSLSQDIYPDFAQLSVERAQTDARLVVYAERLTPESLRAELRYVDSEGKVCRHATWWAVSHLFNHQTHHRGQVTTLLKQLGHDPGLTDFVRFLRAY